jgi:hypothetical protein
MRLRPSESFIDLERFKKWITDRGAEIIPCTNDYELLRFKAREVGVLYKSGKVSNQYTAHTIDCFNKNKAWCGKPENVGRKKNYQKEKDFIKKRDGTDCFYCGWPLGIDITIEHLNPLSASGKNTIGNMVLCHEKCNQEVGNLTIAEKVNIAVNKRIKYMIKNNPHGFEPGNTVILDANLANWSKVKIVEFTPNGMFAKVYPLEGQEKDAWQIMTNRLSPEKY